MRPRPEARGPQGGAGGKSPQHHGGLRTLYKYNKPSLNLNLNHRTTPRLQATGGGGTFSNPLTNSWIITIIGLHKALNRTPNIDCYWVGAVPNLNLNVDRPQDQTQTTGEGFPAGEGGGGWRI